MNLKDVLNQNQIDFSLKELENETDINKSIVVNKKIKEYDFRLPKKFTNEQLRTISEIFEAYSRHLSAYLTGILRTLCEAKITSIDETKYYEYCNALPEADLVGIIDFKPLDGMVLIEFSSILAFSIIDKLLGGSGVPELLDRAYTDIEVALLEKIYKDISSLLKDSWANVVQVDPLYKKFEDVNRANQLMLLDEIVIVISINVKIKDIVGSMSLCIPYLTLEPISEKLFTKYRMSTRIKNSTDKQVIKNTLIDQLSTSTIDVCGVLGKTVITMNDLLKLQIGDVIKTDQMVNKEIKVNIGNKAWFNAQLGTKKNKKALKICDIIEQRR
jgi:flagellar motor switch protein FliM